MHSRILCAIVLACSAPIALAKSTTWNFIYTGLYSSVARKFLPEATATACIRSG